MLQDLGSGIWFDAINASHVLSENRGLCTKAMQHNSLSTATRWGCAEVFYSMRARLLPRQSDHVLSVRACGLVATLSAHLPRRLQLSRCPGAGRRQREGRALPGPSSGSVRDWVGWQSSLGWLRPRNVLHKKETVLSCQPRATSDLKAERMLVFTSRGLSF